MPEAVLEAVAEKIVRSGLAAKELAILWHAGEPLVLPIAYYQRAIEILSNGANVALTYRMQTNGTLVSEAWCDFFERNRIDLGISIDGPSYLHDLNRVTRRGAGTFSKVLSNINLLRRRQIPFYALCVLTWKSLDHPRELFALFEELGPTRVLFNIEEIEGTHRNTSLDQALASGRIKAFFNEYWNLISIHNSSQRVREIERTMIYLLENRPRHQIDNLLARALACISVDTEGGFSTFSPELLSQSDSRYGRFVFGNIVADEVGEIIRSPRFKVVANAIQAGVDACRRECQYFSVCGGGSPSNKLAENGELSSTETLHCTLTVKALTDLALHRLGQRTQHGTA